MRRERCRAFAVIAALVVVSAAGLTQPSPAHAAAPQPLWRAFPLGGQPLIQPSGSQSAKPGPHRSRPQTTAAGDQPNGSRGNDNPTPADDSISISFAQVIVLTTLIAAVVVLTPVLVIRRRLD